MIAICSQPHERSVCRSAVRLGRHTTNATTRPRLPGGTVHASMTGFRRLLPILLLASLILPLLAPLLAFGQSTESGLPACCRRSGKHHCAMSMAEKSQAAAQDTVPKWTAPTERCPYCPASFAPGHYQETFAAPPAQAFYADVSSHPAGVAQTECKRRISRDRSRQKRGPPSQTIL